MLSQDDRRFLSKLGSPEPAGGCRLWSGARTDTGWGLAWHSGRMRYVNHVAWEIEHGPVPEGMRPKAQCGQNLCVAHLALVPKRRLTDDAAEARRLRAGPQLTGP